MILRLGYSKAGLHNLRPSSRDWTLALLVHHKATHTPYVLDPTLRSYEILFAKGMIEAEGFDPSAALLAKREKSRIWETPTLSTDADSRTDTNLKRLLDLKKKKL